ncbi:MAG: HepT-like ribonuclease domain-containing protein [Dermatophilaceae bacterium]
MRRELLLLEEMIDAAEHAHRLTDGVGVLELSRDRQRRDAALLWNFTVLGEAASQVPAEVKAAHPEVPWAQPARLRHRIVHGYWSIDLDVLDTTARERLPGLTQQLRQILVSLDDDSA